MSMGEHLEREREVSTAAPQGGAEGEEERKRGPAIGFSGRGAIPPVIQAKGGEPQASASDQGFDGKQGDNEFAYEAGGGAPVAAGGKLGQGKHAASPAEPPT